MKKILIVFVIGSVLYGFPENTPIRLQSHAYANPTTTSDQLINNAYQHRQNDIQVRGAGVVIRILPDDTKGSRHQKFILKLSSGQTLLISHNIDLAPRINSLRKGDTVEFYGEYEWNSKGGIVHWTHHDPAGRHESGWLEHEGVIYQ